MEPYLPSLIRLSGISKDSFTSNYYEISLFVGIPAFLEKRCRYILIFLSEVCRHE